MSWGIFSDERLKMIYNVYNYSCSPKEKENLEKYFFFPGFS